MRSLIVLLLIMLTAPAGAQTIFNYPVSDKIDTGYKYTVRLLDANKKPINSSSIVVHKSFDLQISPLDTSEWDGRTRYYTVINYEENIKRATVLLPSASESATDFRIGNESVTIEGFYPETPGFESIMVIITDEPFDFRDIFNQGQTRGLWRGARLKDEFLLLVKGSPLSLFDPYVRSGQFKTATVSYKVIMEIESGRGGAVSTRGSGDWKSASNYKTFYNADSTRVYYSPVSNQTLAVSDFPVLQIIDPQSTAVRSSRTSEATELKFRGIAVDKSSRISTVMINNKPVKSVDTLTGFFDDVFQLRPGDNQITVTAKNAAGYETSQLFNYRYEASRGVARTAGQDYMLVIGINQYSTYDKLKNAVKDANDFADLMVSDYGYKRENILSLYDKNATADNIYAYLDSLTNLLGDDDRLLIYYAGHGIYNEKLSLGYWVPVNADKNKISQLIPNNMISRYISSFKAKKVFAIIDACYSGTLLEDDKRSGEDSAYNARIRDFKCRQVLASGRREVVSDGSGENSPFARSLLSYLKKVNSNETLSRDIIRYVMTNVPKTEKQTPIGGALRDVNDENGEFEFVRKK